MQEQGRSPNGQGRSAAGLKESGKRGTMRLVNTWLLVVAVMIGIFALGSPQAHAQYPYQGGPATYVPPPPGPGYSWVNGYMDNGYWIPGRWVWVGQGEEDDDDNGGYAGYAAPAPAYPPPYSGPYAAAPYAGDGDGDGDQGGGFWQGAGSVLGGVVGGILSGGWGGDDDGWQGGWGGDDGGDDD